MFGLCLVLYGYSVIVCLRWVIPYFWFKVMRTTFLVVSLFTLLSPLSEYNDL